MIHKYSLNGYNIVMDTNSGAVHLFDDAPFAMLDYLDDSVPDEPPKAMLDELKDRYDGRDPSRRIRRNSGALSERASSIPDDDYEKFASLMKNAPIKSMCLNISHDCNLRCRYCFAAQGDFGGERMLMPFSVAKSAIDFLIEPFRDKA